MIRATQVISIKTKLPGPRSKAILERARRSVAGAVVPAAPVVIDHAEGALVVDVDGNRFIDFTGGMGALNAGHAPREVVQAIGEQAKKFLHTDFSLIAYEVYVDLAEKLLRLTPGTGNRKLAFFNSGAEAVENAVKLARKATGKSGIVAFEGAFHGRTYMALSLTGKYRPYKQGFGPFMSEVHRVPYPYPYRCTLGGRNPNDCLDRTLAEIERLLAVSIDPRNTAAFIVEPVLGEGGFVIPPAGFLRKLREICDRHEILLIVDEIQTGFGRTGKWFACEHEQVVPDILVLAKSLAAGMPLSAVVARNEIIDAAAGGELGGTYPGNPVACAAALKALEVMEREDLPERARRIGRKLVERWKELAARHPFIGEVRGIGAMVGVEFIEEGHNQRPDAKRLDQFVQDCLQQGVLLVKSGVYGNVLRFLNPLVISDEELDEALDVMEQVLARR